MDKSFIDQIAHKRVDRVPTAEDRKMQLWRDGLISDAEMLVDIATTLKSEALAEVANKLLRDEAEDVEWVERALGLDPLKTQ